MPVNMRDPASGDVYVVDDADVRARLGDGWTTESATDQVQRITDDRLEDEYGGISGKIAAGGAAVLRGATLGGSDLVFDALGEGDEFRNLRDANPGISTVGEIVGGVGTAALSGGTSLAATPTGLVTRAGARIAQASEGAGAATRAGRLVAGGFVEGGADAIGQAITQASLYDSPLDVETLGASILTNGLIGGGGNIAAAGAGKALRAAKGKLDDIASRGEKIGKLGEVSDDLSKLDRKGLVEAEKVETARIIEARKPQQSAFVDDLKAHRQTLADEKIWLATKDADAKAVGNVKEISKISYDADKSIRSMLNNPKNLAENPRRALEALQRQENALEMLAKNEPELRAKFAADESGTRAASLDALPGALERNRALQTRVREFIAAPASPQLDNIAAARDALSSGGGRESIAARMAGGSAYGVGASIASAIPFVGGFLAPFAGAAAAGAVTGKLGGALTKASAEAAKRASSAVDMFLRVGQRVAPAAPVLATKTLQAVRYATEDKKKPAPTKAKLAEVYKTRTDEIKAQTAYQMGVPKMRLDARRQVAAKLAPIAATSPILADRLETLAARRLEFLAKKIPRRPDIAGIPTGPDKWQPSDFEMRSFARTVAAVEDPHGIIERLADGSITPEDAEAMREVYPEMMADVTRQILERLPELREQLPYERRLALSIFTGAPVDPAMDPGVLRVLQASFVEEPGTEGGMQAPKPMPAFGSVKNQEATASQRRQEA